MMNGLQALTEQNRAGLSALEEKLGYRFQQLHHLQNALIHRSYAFEQGKAVGLDNETLEFLGDAVLDLTVGYALFRHFPDMSEGELTKLRAALVNEGHLALMAREIELGGHLLFGRGEEMSRGRQKPSILASAYEAVAGAIFLDGGYDAAAQFVESHFSPYFVERSRSLLTADPKSALQEALQAKYNEPPVYMLEKEEGPDHAKFFHVTVRFRGTVLASGSASSKKEAEQQAAAAALLDLDKLLEHVERKRP